MLVKLFHAFMHRNDGIKRGAVFLDAVLRNDVGMLPDDKILLSSSLMCLATVLRERCKLLADNIQATRGRERPHSGRSLPRVSRQVLINDSVTSPTVNHVSLQYSYALLLNFFNDFRFHEIIRDDDVNRLQWNVSGGKGIIHL